MNTGCLFNSYGCRQKKPHKTAASYNKKYVHSVLRHVHFYVKYSVGHLYFCFITESFTSTSIIVGSILIVLLFLAVTGLVFISYKYHKGFEDF